MKASELAELIPVCCSEVLDTMYFTTLFGSETLTELPLCLEGDRPVAFSLRFKGDVSGSFGIHLEQATARHLAANFLGTEESSLSEADLSEVTGELANMLCGSILSHLDSHRTFALSHPEPGMAPCNGSDALVSLLESEGGVITLSIQLENEGDSL